MPIGKNAIKRVANNGYSNVKTTAPDMENSEVVSEKAKSAPKKSAPKSSAPKASTAKKPSTAPKATPKKAPTKVAPKKSLEMEPELSPVKVAEKVVKKPTKAKKQTIAHICIGDDLPIYLL